MLNVELLECEVGSNGFLDPSTAICVSRIQVLEPSSCTPCIVVGSLNFIQLLALISSHLESEFPACNPRGPMIKQVWEPLASGWAGYSFSLGIDHYLLCRADSRKEFLPTT